MSLANYLTDKIVYSGQKVFNIFDSNFAQFVVKYSERMKIVCSQIIPVMCLAHGYHRISETAQEEYSSGQTYCKCQKSFS